MNKDPAFLFYTQDFITGTMFMSNEDVGIYTRLLCAQHQHGGLIPKDAFVSMTSGHPLVMSKFIETNEGYYNKRLADEMVKRANKSCNMSANAHKRWAEAKQKECKGNTIAYALAMQPEDENEIASKDGGTGEGNPPIPERPKAVSSSMIAAFVEEARIGFTKLDQKYRMTQDERIRAHTVVDELLNNDRYSIQDIKDTIDSAQREGLSYTSFSAVATMLRRGTFRNKE